MLMRLSSCGYEPPALELRGPLRHGPDLGLCAWLTSGRFVFRPWPSRLLASALGALEEGDASGLDVVVAQGAVAVRVDDGDGREDAAHKVGTTGGDVLVGGREQRIDREENRGVGIEPFTP